MQPITGAQIAKLATVLDSGKVSRTQFQKRLENPSLLILFFKTGGVEEVDGVDWLDQHVAKERACHKAFFGNEIVSSFDCSKFEATLKRFGQAKINEWLELGLEPHFLPPVEMPQDATFPGWKVKPEQWFYDQVAAGKVMRLQSDGSVAVDKKALWLGDPDTGGTLVLVDTRCKPSYQDGKQMWEKDNLLEPIIENLRGGKKIAGYDDSPASSRFGVSAEETEQQVCPALAERLGFSSAPVRSERMVEFNFVSQAYPDMPRAADGQTNTWVWFAEAFEGPAYRLFGGSSDCGGLAHVSYHSSVDHWYGRSVRPLAVLNP